MLKVPDKIFLKFLLDQLEHMRSNIPQTEDNNYTIELIDSLFYRLVETHTLNVQHEIDEPRGVDSNDYV